VKGQGRLPQASEDTAKPTKRDKTTTGAKTNQTGQTAQKRGGAGMAKEDRGGEGRTYRIRIAIVQLSGDQWGTWIIILMNTSAW